MNKKKTEIKNIDKSVIIMEYLTQEITYKTLSEKYGVPSATIRYWVRTFRMSNPANPNDLRKQASKEKGLKIELRNVQLKNQLLEEILKIASEQTGINLRKKYGARQS